MSDRYVVELRNNVWLTSDGTGQMNDAIRFKTDQSARSALSDARLHQPFMRAQVRKLGRSIQCNRCHRMKAPRGRDISSADPESWCRRGDCDGYNKDPQPGTMWPGEVER